MPTTRNPRRGSMQFWPRVRSKKPVARVRHTPAIKDVKPAAFAGYKIGMTHMIIKDERSKSTTKGLDIMIPATIIECPPLKVYAVNFYKKTPYGLTLSTSILDPKPDKELARKLPLPKKYEKSMDALKAEDYADIRLLVYTQPKKTSLGKKKPELFELPIGGDVAGKFGFAKEKLGKELDVSDAFEEGSQVDIRAISKGKGNQGPVKRFGIKIRFHKSEKTKRGPGSLGPWHGAKTYRVAHSGQTGYHQRMELNKWVLKIDDKIDTVNPKGDWMRFGKVKNKYIILKGSIPGPSKRLVTMTQSYRPNPQTPKKAPTASYMHMESRQ
jgi:large subunit ribosomal protein L3